MIAFLTSSPTRELTTEHPYPCLDERNGFVVQLRALWRGGRCLMIAAYPSSHAQNDEMTDYYRAAVENQRRYTFLATILLLLIFVVELNALVVICALA